MSMTSATVCAFAVTVFFRIQSLRDRPEAIGRFVRLVFCGTVVLILFVVVHSIVMFPPDSFFGRIITLLGRDITMTDRTYIWNDVYAATEGSPMLGVGYGGFWIGRLANIPWNAHMTWVLGQAHSGYVDTYLQLGLVGVFLLTGLLGSKLSELLASLTTDFEFGCFRITLFLTILFVNMAESTYLRGDHHLWLVFMIVAWKAPQRFELANVPPVRARRGDRRVVQDGGVIESEA
jgi:O-antigen ligase